MNKIRIAYLISFLDRQGPVNVLYNIASNLDYNRFEVFIFTLKREGVNSRLIDFEALPIKIFELKGGGILGKIRKTYKLNQYIKKYQIQIIHSHCFSSLLINSQLSDVKKIHTIHNYPGVFGVQKHGLIVGNVINAIIKVLLKKVDYPVACSKSVMNELIQKDNIYTSYIQNGIPDSYLNNNISKEVARTELNLNQSYKYFISIGRFSNEKNFKFLIDFFEYTSLDNICLIILGDGPLYDEYKCREIEKVLLPGFMNDVSKYLIASDYYVSSSITEGLPLSVLESMSYTLPLLISNIPSHLEILDTPNEYKNFGYTFQHNHADFQIELKKILQDNYSKMSEKSRKAYLNYFTANKMSTNYQNLYNKVLEG